MENLKCDFCQNAEISATLWFFIKRFWSPNNPHFPIVSPMAFQEVEEFVDFTKRILLTNSFMEKSIR